MARTPEEIAHDPLIVVANPDEDCSPEVQRAFLDELFAGPAPEIDSLDAAEAIRVERIDAQP